ncbi:MAG: LysM peptidoglycan-binding domain-containing protein [Microcella sp.]|uniref:LysM peptidoglycan-binding domain-containing protein n=1 Tax=Microcella sp. TaxID=1913979 RepID=UPI0024C904A4|nr:LysM peptidoglycan-binding domain-containing protein [Microcella sp.]UYN84366.1 MAG: LysM peptidoglycan-binding domain-containing protein [Microcella sp.]
MARQHDEPADRAREVFGGLTPRAPYTDTAAAARTAHAVGRVRSAAGHARTAAFTTVPVVLTGALALSLGLAGPVEAAQSRKPAPPKPQQSPDAHTLRAALSQLGAAIMPGALTATAVTTSAAPAVYTVQAGDTVSSVAQRFGLSTASVLALNGLSWKSVIFPGQTLRLTNAPVKTTAPPPATTTGGQYAIRKGDTVSSIAARFGITTQSILDANALTWSSIIYPGQWLTIPGHESSSTIPAPSIRESASDAEIELASLESDADALTDSETSLLTAAASMAIAERPALPVSSPARPTSNPGSGGPSGPSGPPAGGSITPLTAEMRTHAATIIRVGRELGVPQYGIVIALATAMQESSLRNLSWGDRDSVGLFQQRPSSGWGTAADLQIPSHAARLFYVGRPGYTRGLLGIPGWQNMTLTQAAQAVQISAYPHAYAKWEASAWAWYYELT